MVMSLTPAKILFLVSAVASVIFLILLVRHLLRIRNSEQQALIEAEEEYSAKRIG